MSFKDTSVRPMAITPYLFFGGRCEEALAFYTTHLNAKVEMVMRFSESPDPVPPGMLAPGFEHKIMHASLHIRGTGLMASDGTGHDQSFGGFCLSLSVPDKAEGDRVFAALAAGGSVQMPMGATFWSPYFGMVTDMFGLQWMINLPPEFA